MDARLLEFIGELRRAELRISPSEAVDALLAAAEVGLDDRETFRAALAATLVKSARDQETFDRLFDLYFLDLRALDRGLRTALGPDDPGVQALLASLLDGDGPELDPLTAVLLTGEAPALEAAVRAEARRVGLERLAHAAENLLGKLRDGELVVDREIATALLRTGDALRGLLGSIEATGTEGDGDHAELVATLTRLQGPKGDAAGSGSAEAAQPGAPARRSRARR